MAPYIPVPETLQANVRFTLDGQQVENAFNFSYAGSDFATAASSIEGRLNLTWWAALRLFLSDQLVHVETYMVDLDSSSGPVATFSPFTNPAGSNPVNPAPNNVALCITLRTAARGRSFRGRNYLMGISIDSVAGNEIVGGFMTAVVSAYEGLFAVATDQSCEWVVVSRYSGVELVDGKKKPIPREEGISTPITSVLFTDNIVDSQRNRLPNH